MEITTSPSTQTFPPPDSSEHARATVGIGKSEADIQREIEIAQRVRAMLLRFQEAQVTVPNDFEARLMERIRQDTAVVSLIDLTLSGFGRTLLELFVTLFNALPAPRPPVLA